MCLAVVSSSKFCIYIFISAPLALLLKAPLNTDQGAKWSNCILPYAKDRVVTVCSRAVSNTEAELHVARSKHQREMTRLLYWCCVVNRD